MKCSASLLGLKVGDYFNLCNWQLLPPPSKNYLPKQAKITAPDCPIVLSTLTVKEFFNSCNWQLLPQNEPAAEIILPSLPPSPPSDLSCLTVAKFLSLCNWQSIPLEVSLPSQPQPLEQESPLTSQVQAFFQCIPWEGNAEIGGLSQPLTRSPLISPAPGDINLKDLCNLF